MKRFARNLCLIIILNITKGLIRQYLPKSQILKDIAMEEEVIIMDKLNLRPRKCLDFKMPYEVFFGHQPVAHTT